jgi:RNA polymerase sigma-70 factor, ECF subfamily
VEATVDPGARIAQARHVDRARADAGGEDADLVRAAQGGDRDAFGLLYQRFGPVVHGVLLARVPWMEVDDLVQDVFLAALQRLDTLRSAAAFPGWLVAIARNRAADLHRRPLAAPLTEDVRSAEPGPEAEALSALAIIKTLPAAYHETLTLRLVEGMTGPEIAARTGLSAGSVRVNLHRGMKLLRGKVGQNRTTA